VHSKPYSPQGRGKQERLNRYIREAFLSEATHRGIETIDELNDLFSAWAEGVANQRIHKETKEAPALRFERGGPHRQVDPAVLAEAFRWSVTRKVTKTASVPLEGNHYSVDPSLVGHRVELRFVPEDLSRIDVFFEGRPAGAAIPFVIGRHTHKRVPQAAPETPEATGIDYLAMVAATHEGAAGTGAPIDFAQLAMFGADETENGDEVAQ
jgi:putative transposase